MCVSSFLPWLRELICWSKSIEGGLEISIFRIEWWNWTWHMKRTNLRITHTKRNLLTAWERVSKNYSSACLLIHHSHSTKAVLKRDVGKIIICVYANWLYIGGRIIVPIYFERNCEKQLFVYRWTFNVRFSRKWLD